RELAAEFSPCIDFNDEGTNVHFEFLSCSPGKIKNAIKNVFESGLVDDCIHDWKTELSILTGSLSVNKKGKMKKNMKQVNAKLRTLCSDAWTQLWDSSEESTWLGIDGDFTQQFMSDYIAGHTFLNKETGNFINADGTDPTGNVPPTSKESYETGESITSFYNEGATSTILQSIDTLSSCKLQSIMCCFGRDRQYGDNNGDCAENDCDDKPPGDNSNLCYLPNEGNPIAFPGDEKIRCHGMAWGNELRPSSKLRFNNIFYVLMHDHMVTRGYVENTIYDKNIDVPIPMCGCVEDMPPVARADCSEVRSKTTFTLAYGIEGLVVIAGKLDFKFRACRGTNPADDTQQNNDLASHVYKMQKMGELTEATVAEIFEVLVGYDSPGDNENEAACEAAWEDATQGQEYVDKLIGERG
ncbi:hypothetical protein TrRE_jg8511, partial [Triparma retinervis]